MFVSFMIVKCRKALNQISHIPFRFDFNRVQLQKELHIMKSLNYAMCISFSKFQKSFKILDVVFVEEYEFSQLVINYSSINV